MGFVIRWALRLIPSGYTWAALATVLAGAMAAGFYAGHKVAVNAAKSEQLKAVEHAIEQAERIASENAEIEQAQVITQTKIRTVYRTLTKEVVKYVETHPDTAECLDADGLRIWNRANQGTTAAPPG